jgi:hypothetical protein
MRIHLAIVIPQLFAAKWLISILGNALASRGIVKTMHNFDNQNCEKVREFPKVAISVSFVRFAARRSRLPRAKDSAAPHR